VIHRGDKTVGTICPVVNQFLIFDNAWFRDSDILKAFVLFADALAARVAQEGIPEFQQFVNKTTFQIRKDLRIPQGVNA
jgi:hypothetical protein